MTAFSTLLFALSTFIISKAEKGKYGDCSYIVEANDGIYDDALAASYAMYQNLSLPTRAYTMGYCNYFNDYEEGRQISYSYSCDSENDEVTVSLYPGNINDCTTDPAPVTYKYTRENNTDIDYYCGTADCTLTIQRYNNEGNESCDATFALNTYSIVNGQCEYASDLEYYLSASCMNDTSAYDYGIYSDSECAGTASVSAEVSDDSCPSQKDGYPNAIGSLKYMIDECMGDPFEPSTTLPANTGIECGDNEYFVGGECSDDTLCTDSSKCQECTWTSGKEICNDREGVTCATEYNSNCECAEVWTDSNGGVPECDEPTADDCVTYMVKMTFITIIVSWLWI